MATERILDDGRTPELPLDERLAWVEKIWESEPDVYVTETGYDTWRKGHHWPVEDVPLPDEQRD